MSGPDQLAIVAALRRPEAYPGHPPSVHVEETHISYVFLAGPHAFKIKKPVDFGFLDFTTLERRRHFCQREVELNRRLAPEVYLGVVPILPASGGGFRIGSSWEERAVEYAVQMVRLPQEGMLDKRLEQGTATPEMLRSLGRHIADFHRKAARGLEIAAIGDLEGVRFNVEENFSQTEPFIGRTIARADYDAIAAYARAFMARRAALLHTRASEGFVRDGHGDLRAAQVCFYDGRIAVLDCIEFNERFRWADTASDVAFLIMDLEALGHPDPSASPMLSDSRRSRRSGQALARAFREGYLDAAEDPGMPEILPFYQCYRAYVRGKVEGFRLDQPGLSAGEAQAVMVRARHYFDLAARYARSPVGPHLVLVGGLMGTGKTTMAQALARERGLAHLSSDIVRKELAGLPVEERRYETYERGIYSAAFSERTYGELAARARGLLAQGRSVVVDASFSRTSDRTRFLPLAREAGADLLFVLCEASESVVRQRLEVRVAAGTGPSDGRWELYGRQREAFEPPADLPARAVLRLSTEAAPEAVLARLLARLDEPVQ